MTEDFPARNSGNYKENKAQNLMPERMHRLNGRWENVFYELARVLRQMLVGHDFILSRFNLFQRVRDCTIKGTSHRY